ncbi:MAG: hypothetical protein LUO79_00460, partial [Methanomassiliicoccales archaeon]|nr:hypothetical protein [Methanomassiliicoccales archaeon]
MVGAMGDFKFSNGKVKKGILAAIVSAIVLLAIPVMILLVARAITGLAGAFYENANSLVLIVIIASIPAIVLAFFRGHYPKGSASRLVFGEAETASLAVYLLLVLTSPYLSGA